MPRKSENASPNGWSFLWFRFGLPMCFQKLNTSFAPTSSPFNCWTAILKFSILPAVKIQLSLLSKGFQSSLSEVAMMGSCTKRLVLLNFLDGRSKFLTIRAAVNTAILSRKIVSLTKLCWVVNCLFNGLLEFADSLLCYVVNTYPHPLVASIERIVGWAWLIVCCPSCLKLILFLFYFLN